MATGTIAPVGKHQFFDDSGDPLAGGKLYTYEAGTSTPLATYSDVSLTTPNANPIVLDSAGRATIFLSATSYKWVLKTSADVTVYSQDNIGAVPSTQIDNDITGTAGEALTVGQPAYLSDGSGGLTAGRWYKGDADNPYSSTLPEVALVVSDIASGGSGTFRLSGRMTGLSGLTPGASYYISATAGALTTTAPTNARFVGQADSISSLIVTPNPAASQGDGRVKHLVNGRLTLTTNTPVTTSDVSGASATTIYFTPYGGNQIGLYTGSAWTSYAFSQLSIAVPATTNQMYDVFVDYNDGTPILAVTAWTNDTTRATALTTQDGVYVKTGDTQQRYVGSFRTTGVSGQTEDSCATRFVWNYYNRMDSAVCRVDTTDTWTYTLATFQQANASTANQIDVVVGVAEDPIRLTVTGAAIHNAGGVNASVSIGYDSTTTPPTTPTKPTMSIAAPGTTAYASVVATLTHYPAAGRHFYAWLEKVGSAAGTMTWAGDNGLDYLQTGMTGLWRR